MDEESQGTTSGTIPETANGAPRNGSRRSTATELARFEDGSGKARYRARAEGGKHYLLEEPLADILRLSDGVRTTEEIAQILSERHGAPVTGEQVEQAIVSHLVPRSLVEGTEPPAGPKPPAPSTGRVHFGTDFVLRIGLLSESRIRPLVGPLTRLFSPVAALLLPLVLLTHFVFYTRPLVLLPGSPADYCTAYFIAIATVLFHELGHAAACRHYRCEHGEIGFSLYLIFPAFYVDLTRAWRLSKNQRAIIDAGGAYFQMLTVVPLYILAAATRRPYFAMAFCAVDFMVLFSLNPLLKFDGYWLLADLSGLANLQQRALRLIREFLLWPILRQRPREFESGLTRWRLILLSVYAALIAAAIAILAPLMLWVVPRQWGALLWALHAVVATKSTPSQVLMALGRIAAILGFFLFMFRLLIRPLGKLFWRRAEQAEP